MADSFVPTLKWQLKALAVCLAVCVCLFFAVSFVMKKLPPQYQPKTPAAETTPWLD